MSEKFVKIGTEPRHVSYEPEILNSDGEINAQTGSNIFNFKDSLATSIVNSNPDNQVQLNEPLIGGLAWLRVVQLLNFDIYYIGFSAKSRLAAKLYRLEEVETAAELQKDAVYFPIDGGDQGKQVYYSTILDTLAKSNPFQKYIDCYKVLDRLCHFLKIFLSLTAIVICLDKTIANIILCLATSNNIKQDDESGSTNSNMAMVVLILVNLSSLYILFSTVFNGHLIYNLFSRRLFLVSREFQCKTMIMLIPFIYLEYIIDVVFIDNFYEWDYTSNSVASNKFSALANLRVLATEKDEDNIWWDTFLTIIQFSRGIIRISPYIIVNYAIMCLREHINVIRNQYLLTESLKKRTKLRLAVRTNKTNQKASKQTGPNKKKKVNFDNKSPGNNSNGLTNNLDLPGARSQHRKSLVNLDVDQLNLMQSQNKQRQPNKAITDSTLPNDMSIENLNQSQSNNSACIVSLSISSLDNEIQNKDWDAFEAMNAVSSNITTPSNPEVDSSKSDPKKVYLSRIRDFDELESYITNLYIFTGRLNRYMTRQGLGIFFIVHNLLITAAVIRPEAIHGGPIMVYLLQFLMVSLAFIPFVHGESLNSQLEQLSKQIDRIIIQQQLTHNRRDNLVRIRELIHDIRVNCGGMLNFNVEDGIKYLVIAFASAFFIEQERKYTRQSNVFVYNDCNESDRLVFMLGLVSFYA